MAFSNGVPLATKASAKHERFTAFLCRYRNELQPNAHPEGAAYEERPLGGKLCRDDPTSVNSVAPSPRPETPCARSQTHPNVASSINAAPQQTSDPQRRRDSIVNNIGQWISYSGRPSGPRKQNSYLTYPLTLSIQKESSQRAGRGTI